jgi:hypothetical protein
MSFLSLFFFSGILCQAFPERNAIYVYDLFSEGYNAQKSEGVRDRPTLQRSIFEAGMVY